MNTSHSFSREHIVISFSRAWKLSWFIEHTGVHAQNLYPLQK